MLSESICTKKNKMQRGNPTYVFVLKKDFYFYAVFMPLLIFLEESFGKTAIFCSPPQFL